MDDSISRAAAIEYLMTNMRWRDEDGYEVDDADEKRAIITDLVNGIPAVDAVPVVTPLPAASCPQGKNPASGIPGIQLAWTPDPRLAPHGASPP